MSIKGQNWTQRKMREDRVKHSVRVDLPTSTWERNV